jgi:hypothetical protein
LHLRGDFSTFIASPLLSGKKIQKRILDVFGERDASIVLDFVLWKYQIYEHNGT